MFTMEKLRSFGDGLASAMALGLIFGAAASPALAGEQAVPSTAAEKATLAEKLQYVMSYQQTRLQTANVFDTAGGPGVRRGAAWLVRSKNGIRGRIMTGVATGGDPYTLWISVYNNPTACATSPCSPADFANPAVDASVFNGSGAISADSGLGSGVVNIDFSTLSGRLPKGLFVLVGNPSGLRRNNGYRAEIHLVIHQHPPIAADSASWIADLTTTGPANRPVRVAQFVACPEATCPESVR
jgi:hypothetical protein